MKRSAVGKDCLLYTSDMTDLADFVLGKSVEYRDKPGKNGTVHTIIEFITKKSAAEFYAFIQEKEPFFDEVFLLSGTILEPLSLIHI